MPVRRALAALGEALAREMTSSPCAGSWLGRIEPRAKILGIFTLVFASTLLHSLWSLGVLFFLAIVVSASIGLSGRRLARVWLGVPLFSLAIILPAATSLVTPGETIFTIVRFGHTIAVGPWTIPETITVTASGLVVAGRFLLRSTDCVMLSYLLIASTEPAVLLDGLRRLGMPRVFGMVLTMAHRYLAVMLQVAEEIHLAKLSRTITAQSVRSEQRWVAAGIGVLFRRTHKLAHEVNHAMVSRGYDGNLRVKSSNAISCRDTLWVAAALALSVGLVITERALAGGFF